MRLLTLLLLILSPALLWATPEELELTLDADDSLAVVHYGTDGPVEASLVWLPSEHGFTAGLRRVIDELARLVAPAGIDVFVPDYHTSFFAVPGRKSLNRFAAPSLERLLSEIEQRAYGGHYHPVFLIAANRAAIPALRVIRERQSEDDRLIFSLILINPDVAESPPIPGEEPRYAKVVGMTNLPLFIVQAEKSPWRLALYRLRSRLQRSGSDVFLQSLPGVRDRFYFRPDADLAEQAEAGRLPRRLVQAMQLLTPYMQQPRRVSNGGSAEQTDYEGHDVKRRRGLQPYTGPQGLDFSLPDLDGRLRHLDDWNGSTLLVNFWASWCPPCVHEIPSMVELKKRFSGETFEIVAINLGEKKTAVESFLRQQAVNFPVLLDEANQTAKTWRVNAYPTTFLLDAEGNIRFALAGGHDWRNAETLKRIRALITER